MLCHKPLQIKSCKAARALSKPPTIIQAFLTTPYTEAGAADISFPDTKYEVGDCITPTDLDRVWFGKSARVEDMVYSKKYEDFVYDLYIPESAVSIFGTFKLERIDHMIFELKHRLKSPLYCKNLVDINIYLT